MCFDVNFHFTFIQLVDGSEVSHFILLDFEDSLDLSSIFASKSVKRPIELFVFLGTLLTFNRESFRVFVGVRSSLFDHVSKLYTFSRMFLLWNWVKFFVFILRGFISVGDLSSSSITVQRDFQGDGAF